MQNQSNIKDVKVQILDVNDPGVGEKNKEEILRDSKSISEKFKKIFRKNRKG